MENNETTKTTKTTVKPELTNLERVIILRSEQLNIPALAAFFEITEDEVKAALAKK